MKKFLHLLLLYLALAIPAGVIAADPIRDFELGNVKIPVYQKGKLAFVIFADNGNRRSLLLSGKNTLIDRLVDNVDVDKIPDGWMANIYPLDAKLPEVVQFWKKRYLTSEAVIFTPRCRFDRKTNIVSSSNEVKMRTPAFDLDGIGFRSDLNKKELEINSDVQIIARRDDSDPREIIPGRLPMPAKYTTVSATADSLRMDMVNNELMLIGNVKVVDGMTTLTCDRLTIFLKSQDEQKKSSAAPKNNTGDSSAMLKGISRVLADGEVVFTRRPENNTSGSLQVAKCEHLDYDLDSGLIILTDPDKLPELAQDNHRLTGERIELLRFSRKAFVKGKCKIVEYQKINNVSRAARTIDSAQAAFDGDANLNIFTGNVIVKDTDATINCDRMEVFLKQTRPAKTADSKTSAGEEFSPVSGSQELDRIHCVGNVKIVTVAKADSTASKTAKKNAAKPVPTVITSNQCDLDYPADKLVFRENVIVNHQGDTLKCDRLDLFLKNSIYRKTANSGNKSGGVALGGRGSGNKTLTKAIASGNVYMKDKSSDLATELMTLLFKELPPGTQQKPGMFATRDIQLTRIICDGKVVANSFPGAPKANAPGKTRTLKTEHAMSDMETNRSEFHKDVYLKEDNNELFCRDMFVYTGTAPQVPENQPAKPAAVPDDPDADPFDIEIKENAAPSKIALSNGVELQRVVCKNDVILINRDKNGKTIRAEGDTAIYTVKTADVVITADAPRRAALRSDGRIQYSDLIRGNLREETLHSEGNVQMVPDKSFKKEEKKDNKK